MQLRSLFGALAVLAVMALGTTAAGAHAVLQATLPADGSLLEAAPQTAQLTFNEVVRPLVVRLVAPDGTETDLTGEVLPGATLVIPLPGLGTGTYVLSWRVVSDDGHPIPGSLLFSLGEVTGGAATGAEADGALRSGLWLARFLMTTGLVLGVGGALFGAVAALPLAARRPVALAAITGGIAAPLYLGLHGLDALGLGLSELATPAPWAAAWGTSFGPSVFLAVLAAGLAILSLRWHWLAWGAAVLLAISYAASGHAGAAEPRWMTRPMVALHLLALSFWIGALIPLALSLRSGAAELRRFSALIPVVLLLLFGSGLALAVVQLGRDPAQWMTPYGYILGAKLALLAVILALAAWNRWRLTAPVLAGDAKARRHMRRGIGAELVLAVLILGLSAGWRFTPPPRALALAGHVAAGPAYGHLHSDRVMASLIVTPGQSGRVNVEIQLTDDDMAPLQPLELTVTFALPERGIERLIRPAAPVEGQRGIWVIPDLILPLAGTWTVGMEVRISRFEQVRLAGEIDIN